MSAHRPIQSTADLLVTLWRGRVAIIVATILGGVVAAGVSLVIPRSYTAKATLMISDSRLATTAAVNTHFNPRLNYTFVAMIHRGEVLKDIIAAQPALQEKEIQVEDLSDAIEVKLVNNSRLINVSVTLFDPQLAAAVCNELTERAEQFSQHELHEGQAETIRLRLEPELERAQAEFDAAEDLLAQATINGSRQSLEQSLSDLNVTLSEVEVKRSPLAAQLEAQRRDQALEQPLDARIVALQEKITAFRNENNVESLREQFQAIWLQLASLQREQNRLGEEDARLEGVKAQIAALEIDAAQMEPTLAQAELEDQRLQSVYDSLIAEREELHSLSTPTLEAMVAGYDQEIAAFSDRSEGLRSMIGLALAQEQAAQGRLNIAEGALRNLQIAHAEAAMRLEEKQQGLETINAATTPFYPSAPKRKALTILAAAFAMLLAAAWVVARENILASLESQPGR